MEHRFHKDKWNNEYEIAIVFKYGETEWDDWKVWSDYDTLFKRLYKWNIWVNLSYLDEDGNIVLGDEMLTPDSSRFWPVDGYEKGKGQPSFDKQFARDWLKSDENKNEPEDWVLPQEIVDKTIDKYLSAYKMLTGEDL